MALAAGYVAGACFSSLASGCAFAFPTDNLTGGVEAGSDDASGSPDGGAVVPAPLDGQGDDASGDDSSAEDAPVVDSTVPDSSPPDDGGMDGGMDAAPDTGPVNACEAGGARVFVTAGVFSGNLGGTAGADKSCQSAATAAGLGGSWNAWLSDSTTTASQRIYSVTGGAGYVLLNGAQIAASLSDLSSPTMALLHPIDTTETGSTITSGFEAWTGTDLGGALSPGFCAVPGQGDWMSSADDAGTTFVGLTSETSAKWSNVYQQFCNRTTERLYCFERCM